MSDYVATAAAERRLREVLEAGFAYPTDVEGIAEILLRDAKIEYKPRLKAVLITLPIPDKAPERKSLADGDPSDDQGAVAPGESATNDAGFARPVHEPGTVVEFQPTSTEPNDDYFTE